MAGPVAALKAKSADDRLLAAALLIVRYKTYDSANVKTEPVPAAETRLLFTVLAEADWQKDKAGGDPLMTPLALFQRLRLSKADGWVQPRDPAWVAPTAKAWLKANAGSYKLTRSVRNKVTPVPVEEPGR
jgi:hypothetical protein